MKDLVTMPSLIGGALFVAEAIVSPWMDPHWGYHALNVPLSLAVVLAMVGMLRSKVAAVSRTARVGAWITLVAGMVSVIGGLVPIALEPTGLGTSPGWVEGIVHTFTLLVFLGLLVLAAGNVRVAGASRPAMVLIGVGTLSAIVLVLADFSSPWVFMLPEALVGIGLAWVGLGRGVASRGRAAST